MRLPLAIFTAGLLSTASAQGAEHSPLDALAFLLGKWGAVSQGQPGQAAGRTEFTWSLQDRVIVRTNIAEYAGSAGSPASRHDDLMVIYADSTGLRADYFDSEGHTIRYRIMTPSARSAVFTSDIAAGGPRYRLTYMLRADGQLNGTFEIAPPDHSDAFQRYLSWQARRVDSTGGG